MFKFLHAADIHLDSPLRGLRRYEGAPLEQLRQATRRALENLVQLALDEEVDFVLIAGDLYDGDWDDYSTPLCFIRQAQRLQAAGIPLFLIAGNHDAANLMTRTLRLPEGVHKIAHDQPETRVLEQLGVAIHGQSFATRAVEDDLSAAYPAAVRGCFNIGLLHTSAGGRPGHEPYAPCTLDGLKSRGYDYWALGHIHQAEVLHPAEPLVIFPGNLQGRHVRECGAKGCQLVTVDQRGQLTHEFRPLDVLRWEICRVDATECEHADDLLAGVTDRLSLLERDGEGRSLAVRVQIEGPTRLHEKLSADPIRWEQEVRSAGMEAGSGAVWIERVKLNTQPLEDHDPSAWDGPLGELVQYLQVLRDDPAAAGDELRWLDDLARKLPAELTRSGDLLLLEEPSRWNRLLADVEHSLVGRLVSQGAAE